MTFLKQLRIAHCMEKEANKEYFWSVLQSYQPTRHLSRKKSSVSTGTCRITSVVQDRRVGGQSFGVHKEQEESKGKLDRFAQNPFTSFQELEPTEAKMDKEDIVCHLMLTVPVS